jgi:hypothetical protein
MKAFILFGHVVRVSWNGSGRHYFFQRFTSGGGWLRLGKLFAQWEA